MTASSPAVRHATSQDCKGLSALRYVGDYLQATGLFEEINLLADPDEPRDLLACC